MASRAINIYSPLPRPTKARAFPAISPVFSAGVSQHEARRIVISHRNVVCCSATQESSTAAVADKKEAEPVAAVKPAAKEAPAKPKKAPEKALPQLMEEEVIPSLKSTLEAHGDLSQIELSFQDNRLEGSFLKKDIPYYFWAFFPNGTLTGPKGFSLSSYGSRASTVEPFLIDEKRVTAKHVVFWVEKRLAAQAEGLIPAREPTHAIAAAIREALHCKETGKGRVILMAMCGHGHFDLAAYEKYLQGHMIDLSFSNEKVQESLASIPQVVL